MRVHEIMTAPARTVRPGTSLKEVAALLTEHGISGLPVVDEHGELLGVVSEGDILFKEGGATTRYKGALGWLLDPAGPDARLKLEARTAVEAMTAPAITIGPKHTVSQAAAVMLEEGVNRLPVVDDGGRLVGIVTRADLVRAFVRPDRDIAAEIRDDVALRTLWIAPEDLEVEVREGEVELSGRVGSETDAQLLERFAARVPGVVSVDSRLEWEGVNGR